MTFGGGIMSSFNAMLTSEYSCRMLIANKITIYEIMNPDSLENVLLSL
jgi:hypothetical protein